MERLKKWKDFSRYRLEVAYAHVYVCLCVCTNIRGSTQEIGLMNVERLKRKKFKEIGKTWRFERTFYKGRGD